MTSTSVPPEWNEIHRTMVRSRAFEEVAIAAAERGLLPGSWMSGVGQEGAVGILGQLRPDDFITYTHRGAYCFISRGCDPVRLLAELMGRAAGYCGGKGGRHIADLEHGVPGKSGTIGAHAPLAAGLATAIQIREEDAAVVSFFGEGASNRGTTHSAFNMAAISRLPVVWVCENNGYCWAAPASAYTITPDIWKLAAGYGMPGEAVDGNDVLAVHDAGRRALERARAGEGPSLIELKTYRMRAFSEAATDDRDPAEIRAWAGRDPIFRFERVLIGRGLITAEGAASIWTAARSEMEGALAEAEQNPFPDPAAAFEDLFA